MAINYLQEAKEKDRDWYRKTKRRKRESERMKEILSDIALVLLVLTNTLVAVVLGFHSIFSSLEIMIYNDWLAIKILAMTCLAMLGHLYIMWQLLKFAFGEVTE